MQFIKLYFLRINYISFAIFNKGITNNSNKKNDSLFSIIKIMHIIRKYVGKVKK